MFKKSNSKLFGTQESKKLTVATTESTTIKVYMKHLNYTFI